MEESRKWKRGEEEARAENSEEKLVIGSLIWLMSPGRTNCSIETSLGREASTSGFLHSQRLSRVRDDTSSMSTSLRGS